MDQQGSTGINIEPIQGTSDSENPETSSHSRDLGLEPRVRIGSGSNLCYSSCHSYLRNQLLHAERIAPLSIDAPIK